MRKNQTMQTVVFDWNGTLLDDLLHSLCGFNAVLRLFGVREFSVSEYQKNYTVPFIKLYEQAACDPVQLRPREQEIHTVFHAAYDEAVKTARLREGAESLLGFLRSRDTCIIVLSNHTVPDIEFQSKRLGIFQFFDAVLANPVNGVAYQKRGKDRLLKDYMKEKGLQGGCIVGDTVEEAEIGRDIGLVSVALTGGMCAEERLREVRPDHLIHSLAELQPIFQEGRFAA
jgi:phosphoglycolate phosphatase